MRAYKSLENKLTSITNYFAERAFDDQRFEEVRELIEQHDEYGEAYHLLCYLISQHQLAIPNDTYETIVELGKQMEVEEQAWLSLTSLMSVLGKMRIEFESCGFANRKIERLTT